MATPCFSCGETGFDKSWPGAKFCPSCGIHLCSKCGSGRNQCPKCRKYILR